MKKIICFLFVFLVLAGISRTDIFAESNYVNDEADLLNDEEERELAEKLTAVSEKWGIDVAVVNISSASGLSEREYADLYAEEHYRKDNVVLLTVMDTRYVHISTAGKGIDAFTDYGIDLALDGITVAMADGDFPQAYRTFARIADEYFEAASRQKPIDHEFSNRPSSRDEGYIDIKNPGTWLGGALAGLLGSLGITFFRAGKLKSVYKAGDASDYIVSGSFDLKKSQDVYLYQTVSRTRIVSNNNAGGSSIHHSSSGGVHGGGGRHF